MRAIILAAGRGARLSQSEDSHLPKCLLKFGQQSLLERHLRLLQAAGVQEVVLGLGFEHALVEAELARLAALGLPRAEIFINERFTLGSVLTVHVVADAMRRGGDVLLMDADVLYDERIMQALTAGPAPSNRILIDREFEAGDEPVKVCVRDGIPVELRKQVAAGLQSANRWASSGLMSARRAASQTSSPTMWRRVANICPTRRPCAT